MTLTEKDLQNIKDIIEFSIDQSERRSGLRFEKIEVKLDKVSDNLADFRKEMNREISDIAETQHEFLQRFGDHEVRIKKLELKTGVLKS